MWQGRDIVFALECQIYSLPPVLRCLWRVLYSNSFLLQIGMCFLWFVSGAYLSAFPAEGSQASSDAISWNGAAAVSLCLPRLVCVGSAAAMACARHRAAAGLGASGKASACTTQRLIQQ